MNKKRYTSLIVIVVVALVLALATVFVCWRQGLINFNKEEAGTPGTEATETVAATPALVIHLFDFEGKETSSAFGPSLLKEAEALHKKYESVETGEWVRYLFASYASPYVVSDKNYPDATVKGTCLESFVAWAMTVQHDTSYDILGEPAKGIEDIKWGDNKLNTMFEDIVKKMSEDINYQQACYEKWLKFLYEDGKFSIEEGKKISLAGMNRNKEEFAHLHQCSVEREGTWAVFEYNGKKAYLRLDCGGQPGKDIPKQPSKPIYKDEPGTQGDEPGTPGTDPVTPTPTPHHDDPVDPPKPTEGCTNPEDAPKYPGNKPTTEETSQTSGGETKTEPTVVDKEEPKTPDPGGNPVPYPGSGIPAYVPGNAGTDGSVVSGDTAQP